MHGHLSRRAGGRFADQYGCEFVSTYEEVCRHPKVDYVDVCTFPDFRLQPIAVCAETGKHVQVQKPISTNLETARADGRDGAQGAASCSAWSASIASTIPACFWRRRSRGGRLGKLLQCDCYVKWYRSAEYYSRPIKGSWATEGGGALINQAIHRSTSCAGWPDR